MDHFGSEVTLYYKYLKFLERTSLYLCVPGFVLCLIYCFGGQLSLAGATTIIFDAGLVMFGMGNVALVEGSGLTWSSNTSSWSSAVNSTETTDTSFTKEFRLFVVGWVDAITCFVFIILVFRLHWLQVREPSLLFFREYLRRESRALIWLRCRRDFQSSHFFWRSEGGRSGTIGIATEIR